MEKDLVLLFRELYSQNAIKIDFRQKDGVKGIEKKAVTDALKKYNSKKKKKLEEKELIQSIFKCIRLIDKYTSHSKLNENDKSLLAKLEEAFGKQEWKKFMVEKELEKSFGYSALTGLKSEILTKRSGDNRVNILAYHHGLHISSVDMDGVETTTSLELRKEEVDLFIEAMVKASEDMNELEKS
ncbi:hypothetical protein IA829_13570 [Listeria seeligeri]|uniref:hypothetical protein n=1 Tax=Listeria seeligeri TaxID=1640 RepID=UPI0016263535|nr:hypothetical protein [Listeria seeligeri]MBC1989957.1 hypothetical protein [Listeria seeligeri]MBF2347465.1 hypothetical protein [Listeria seeligeri]MBF2374937.1 hypothetical protein [Listeria seeligeri]MBF2421414.1 hypothetical protein [Listeria seeligeri]MBF2476954.1 hypothetical protein [Listeria seeligeri]